MGYNAFNVYCRELAPRTVIITGDRAQGDGSKHCANSNGIYHIYTQVKINKLFQLNIINNV